MRRYMNFKVFVSVLVLGIAALGAQPMFAAAVIGQVATGSMQLDGVAAPPGTTVMSETVLATGQDSATVYLQNGQTAMLEPETRARFEVNEGGELLASVGSGQLLVSQPSGEYVRIGSEEPASFNQEGTVGEGEAVESTVTMCECADPAPKCEGSEDPLCVQMDDGCDDWDPIEVALSEVDAKKADGLVVAGNNDLGLDGNCEEEILVPFWTTGKKVLVGVLVAAGGILLLDDDSDDADTDDDGGPQPPPPPASPAAESGN